MGLLPRHFLSPPLQAQTQLLLLHPTWLPCSFVLTAIVSQTVLFSSLPDIFLCLGLPASPKEPFWHCSELISISLVPENDLPVLLFNVSFPACLNFTHHTFCGKRKLESDSVFCFPPNQNRRLSKQVFQADVQYFPWQISHWLSKMSHWWCSGIPSTPECHGIISLVVAIFHVYFHSPV